MKGGFHSYSVHRVWQHGFGMAVDYTVDCWKSFIDFAVDKALLIPLLGLRINGIAVGDMVLDEI